MQLSAYVITYNEERFIRQCLESLCTLSSDIVVVDAFSTDSTPEIVRSFPQVRFYQRPMPARFADQRNFAADLCTGKWVLFLDADELFHPDFTRILPALVEDERYLAYSFPRLALLHDAEHYIDLPAIIPGEWDTQIRLHRKGLLWSHEDGGGVHEGLVIDGRIAASHPCCVSREVRYVHYPLLHYQLLKNDAELQTKASAILDRQAPEDRQIVTDNLWVQKNATGAIVVPDSLFWVQRKHRQYPLRSLCSWVSWLRLPPETDAQRLQWLHDPECRIDELIEYTGLNYQQCQHILGALRETEPATNPMVFKPAPGEPEHQVISCERWHYVLAAYTLRWLEDQRCQQQVRAIGNTLNGEKSVFIHADGIGDLSLELIWRGIHSVTYSELEGPTRQFFEWRCKRFGLAETLPQRTLSGKPEISGHYDVIISLDALGRTPEPESVLKAYSTHASLLVLGLPGEMEGEGEAALPLTLSALMTKLRWYSLDGFLWRRDLGFRVKRKRSSPDQKRLLVPLMHPPWLYNLAHLDHQFEILPTAAWSEWPLWVRPLRSNMHMLPINLWRLPDAVRYECLNIAPLRFSDWDGAFIQHEDDIPVMTQGEIPLLFMAHSHPSNAEIVRTVTANRSKIRAAVFTSGQRKNAWEWQEGVVLAPAVDTSVFEGYHGEFAQCLVVCNSYLGTEQGQAARRLEHITRGLPTLLCDPAISELSDCSFPRIRQYYRTRRVYVHAVQDRAIMSLMEAMSTGMPAVIWKGYSDGILDSFEDGVNCFLSEDLDYLHERTRELLSSVALCRQIGAAGRETVRKKFDLRPWLERWECIIDEATR